MIHQDNPRKQYFSIFLKFIPLLLFVLFYSCQKSEKKTDIEKINVPPGSVAFVMGGINEEQISDFSLNKNSSVSQVKNSSQDVSSNVQDMGNFLLETSFDTKVNSNTKLYTQKFAASTRMATNKKYRLIIFNSSNIVTPVYNQVLSSQDAGPVIKLDYGVLHYWVAFSYNDEGNDVPDLVDIKYSKAEYRKYAAVQAKGDFSKPLLVAHGDFSNDEETTEQIILFKHKLNPVKISFDVEKYPSAKEITSINAVLKQQVSVDQKYFMAYNDFAENYPYTFRSFPGEVRKSDIPLTFTSSSTNKKTWTSNTVYILGIYGLFNSPEDKFTQDIQKLTTLDLQINSFSMTGTYLNANNAMQDITRSLISKSTSISVNLPSTFKESNTLHAKISVRLNEAEEVPNFFTGKVWAKGNLVYNSETGEYKNSSEVNTVAGQSVFNCDYFWAYGKLLPWSQRSNSNYANSNGDPCTRVLPQGTWRMPTKSEIVELSAPRTSPYPPPGYQDEKIVPSYIFGNQNLYVNKAGVISATNNCTIQESNNRGYYLSYDSTNGYVIYYFATNGVQGHHAITSTGAFASLKASIRCIKNIEI